MSPETPDHDLIKKLLLENQRLLEDNNKLLHKMRRSAQIGLIFRIIWFVIIFAAPFYFYITYIQPNFEALQEKTNFLEQFNSENSQLGEWYKNLTQ